jgi:2-polyprenyl-3-methyl-5-hydroxy-6-metoxy-1,4-benzoquinol methylase
MRVPSGAAVAAPAFECRNCLSRRGRVRYTFAGVDAVIRECVSCSLMVLDPLPTEEDLKSVYNEGYFHNEHLAGTDVTRVYGYIDYISERINKQRGYRSICRTLQQLVRSMRKTPKLLDIGCGLGLLGQYLHECGNRAAYVGVDPDGAKIDEARAAAMAGALDFDFATVDAASLPPFSGDVALIDVLHYLPESLQQQALTNAASRVAPGGTLVIRNVLRDASWRFRVTVAEERFLALLGWMRFATGHFPRREDIESPLAALGFDVRVEPLWGGTPFNSYLIVARRARSE